MLNLVKNEWMKIMSKKGTYVLIAMMFVLLLAITGISRYVSTLDFGMDETPTTWQQNEQEKIESFRLQIAEHTDDAEWKAYLEDELLMSEYRLQHDLPAYESNSFQSNVMTQMRVVSSIVLLLIVIVASGIVASEFSDGTIKMLMTRPMSRSKILTSKLITIITFGMFLFAIGIALSFVLSFLFFPSGEGQELRVAAGEVVKVSLLGKSLQLVLYSLGSIIITTLFAFMISTVFRSNSLAIGLALFINFTGSIVVVLLQRFEIAKYIVFTHMDLTMYLNHQPVIDGITLPFSIAVLAVYSLIFVGLSYWVFTKRDIAT